MSDNYEMQLVHDLASVLATMAEQLPDILFGAIRRGGLSEAETATAHEWIRSAREIATSAGSHLTARVGTEGRAEVAAAAHHLSVEGATAMATARAARAKKFIPELTA